MWRGSVERRGGEGRVKRRKGEIEREEEVRKGGKREGEGDKEGGEFGLREWEKDRSIWGR